MAGAGHRIVGVQAARVAGDGGFGDSPVLQPARHDINLVIRDVRIVAAHNHHWGGALLPERQAGLQAIVEGIRGFAVCADPGAEDHDGVRLRARWEFCWRGVYVAGRAAGHVDIGTNNVGGCYQRGSRERGYCAAQALARRWLGSAPNVAQGVNAFLFGHGDSLAGWGVA